MYILPHFYPLSLYPLSHSFNIYFYVRWPGLHPHMVFVISFHIIRLCVSVHFLGPLIQFSISFLHCLLSVCIIVLASVPNFYSFNFPYGIPVRSSQHAGLCHIARGVSSFLCRFHVHMVIVGVGNIARLFFFSFKFIVL